jgi:PAS domain-containing protein
MLSPADIHPLEDLRWIMPQFEAQSRGEKKTASDIPCLRKDGTKFYADINAACIEISGRPHLVGLFRDVTERKRNEDHAQGHLEELRRWQAVMLDREDRIQELKREVNDLSRSKGKSPPYPSQETAPDPVGRVS